MPIESGKRRKSDPDTPVSAGDLQPGTDHLQLLPIRAPDLRGKPTERPAALPSKMPPALNGGPQEDSRATPRVTELPEAAPNPHIPETRTSMGPMMQVEVRYSCGPTRAPDPSQRWLEVWTSNTVYMLDQHMCCVEVLSADGGTAISDHSFVGAKLVGGQRRGPDGIEVSYPLPKPGAAAVFEIKRGLKRRFSRTSAVKRVVAQLNVVQVPADGSAVSWDEISRR